MARHRQRGRRPRTGQERLTGDDRGLSRWKQPLAGDEVLLVEIPSGDHAGLEGGVPEPRALGIARERLDLELLEQCAKLSLDRLDAELEFVGEFAVRWRCGESDPLLELDGRETPARCNRRDVYDVGR
jgi:hypothetical protein